MSSVEEEYSKLVEEILRCRKCPLYISRKKPVPGEGSLYTEIMFVGEAPGARENETGRPFVGAAGQFLTRLIEGIGLTREKVYITNIVKCRPPNNRDPNEEEIIACLPYLKRQILLIRPKLIVTLGRHAARVILELSGLKFRSITREHGKIYDIKINSHRMKLIPTYHPAAALYNPALKQILIDDFNIVKKYLVNRDIQEKGPLDKYIK